MQVSAAAEARGGRAVPGPVAFVAKAGCCQALVPEKERVAVPPEGDKSPHVWQELWGFEGVVAAAGMSTLSNHRLPLRPALRAKLTPPCGFGSATRIFFLRSAITYRSRD